MIDAEEYLFVGYALRNAHLSRHPSTLWPLRSLQLRIGIVTNGVTDFQTKHIKVLSLHHQLSDAVLISQREGLRKPDASLFRRVVDRLDVSPEHCFCWRQSRSRHSPRRRDGHEDFSLSENALG